MGRTKTKAGWSWTSGSKPCRSTPRRLININTLELRTFDKDVPRYAALSHRWSDAELTCEDYLRYEDRRNDKRFSKIRSLCRFVQEYNEIQDDDFFGTDLRWCWVDSCCIDQKSSAEVSEAVNSMAAWYENCDFCVAYLRDVISGESSRKWSGESPHDWEQSFRDSEWFRRGWTLQELLFPGRIYFCNKDWKLFLTLDASSHEARKLIREITGIPENCFVSTQNIYAESVASRMSWAANRSTTRREDEAYSLLGIFHLTIPLIYGEGAAAFTRLQEEIIKQCDDESVFAWVLSNTEPSRTLFPLLAESPAAYHGCGNVICADLEDRKPYSITNKGLEFQARAVRFSGAEGEKGDLLLLQLNCCRRTARDEMRACSVAVMKGIRRGYGPTWARVHPWDLDDRLWDYAQGRHSVSRISEVPAQIYYLALAITRISHAGNWDARSGLAKQDMPVGTLAQRLQSLKATDARVESGPAAEPVRQRLLASPVPVDLGMHYQMTGPAPLFLTPQPATSTRTSSTHSNLFDMNMTSAGLIPPDTNHWAGVEQTTRANGHVQDLQQAIHTSADIERRNLSETESEARTQTRPDRDAKKRRIS